MGLLVVAEDDEREVDDDVGLGDQVLDRVAVEDVARRYSVRFQPCSAGSNGRRAMPTIRPTSGRVLEHPDRGPADVAGRAGDRDGRGPRHRPSLTPRRSRARCAAPAP